MTNKNKLVGLSGLAGSGKDTAADYLWERYAFAKLAFADPLRAAASEMFGVRLEVFHDRKLKDTKIAYWNLTPREMLQLLGNEAVKPVFGPDIWARRWLLSYNFLKDTDHVVVSDVRFDLEANMIRALGGTILHITRQGAGAPGAAANHISEGGITFIQGDIRIDNSGPMPDLYAQLHDVATLGASRS